MRAAQDAEMCIDTLQCLDVTPGVEGHPGARCIDRSELVRMAKAKERNLEDDASTDTLNGPHLTKKV